MKKPGAKKEQSPARLIDARIAEFADWRGETYKAVVKLTFFKGASLKDPACLFNASLEGNARRAIDIREGQPIDAAAFKTLIRAAVSLNQTSHRIVDERAKTSRRSKALSHDQVWK